MCKPNPISRKTFLQAGLALATAPLLSNVPAHAGGHSGEGGLSRAPDQLGGRSSSIWGSVCTSDLGGMLNIPQQDHIVPRRFEIKGSTGSPSPSCFERVRIVYASA